MYWRLKALSRIISRLNAGDAGGPGPGGEADPGAVSGETIGAGQMGGQGGSGGGAGSSDAGPLGGQGTLSGILSGGREGMDAIAAQEGVNAVAAAAAEAGATSVDSGDPTSQGFGGTVIGGSIGEGGQSPGVSAELGKAIGEAVLSGNMTASEANTALAGIGGQNEGLAGIIGEAAANTGAAVASTPGVLSGGLTAVGMPVASGLSLAGLAAALSGQGMLGGGAEAEPGGQVGPAEPSELQQLASTIISENIGADEELAPQVDRLAPLSALGSLGTSGLDLSRFLGAPAQGLRGRNV